MNTNPTSGFVFYNKTLRHENFMISIWKLYCWQLRQVGWKEFGSILALETVEPPCELLSILLLIPSDIHFENPKFKNGYTWVVGKEVNLEYRGW